MLFDFWFGDLDLLLLVVIVLFSECLSNEKKIVSKMKTFDDE